MKNLKITFMVVVTFMIYTTGFCNSNFAKTENQIEWEVKTNKRIYKGISNSLSDAKISIGFITIGEIIEKVNYNEVLVENDNLKSLFVWEIESSEGIVQGNSKSYEHAKKCLEVLEKNTKIYSKTITKEDYITE